MSEYQHDLKQELASQEYRYAYAEDFLNTYVATQIRVLREQRKMKQGELADLIGTKQSGISRLENVNYSAWKTETLRKVARALGVRLRITFETFGTLLDDSAKFSAQSLERPEFAHDPVFHELSTPIPVESEAVGPSCAAVIAVLHELSERTEATQQPGYQSALVTLTSNTPLLAPTYCATITASTQQIGTGLVNLPDRERSELIASALGGAGSQQTGSADGSGLPTSQTGIYGKAA